MSSREKTLYRFGDFLLDPGRRLLLRSDHPVQLTPKVFDTLLVLIEERGRPVPYDELIRRVWSDTAAGKNNLDQNIFLLRRALGDGQRYVQNVAKVGYQFVAPVAEEAPGGVEQPGASDAGPVDATYKLRPAWSGQPSQDERGTGPAGTHVVQPESAAPPNPASRAKFFNLRMLLLVSAGAVALAGSLFGLGRAFGGFKGRTRQAKLTRLAGAENSRGAAISPDGKYLARVVADAKGQWLELRQISTGSSVVLVPAGVTNYFGLTFSPGGDYVYFNRQVEGEPANSLYRVPALGGDVRKVLAGVDSPVTFSPDGGRLAFVRFLRQEQTSLKGTLKESALIIADAETGGERILRKRSEPEFYSDAGPSWSPDGRLIACAAGAGSSVHGVRMTVVAVDTDNGAERAFASRDWAVARQAAWLSDGSGVIAVAEESSGWAQIWHVAYSSGEARRVTNDLDNYSDLSLASAADALVTTRAEARFNLWVIPGGSFSRARQITFGGDHAYRRVAWTPDGRIVFPSNAAGYREIWVVGADGTGHRQLTFDRGSNLLPSVSPDGRYIVFSSDRAGRPNIWRVDIDGGNPKRLTDGEQDFGPRVSPDGRWVVYTSASAGKETVWRVPIDGGVAGQVVDAAVVGPDVSPDGKYIVTWYKPSPESPRKIAIFSWDGGGPVKVFEALPPQLHPVRWSADGRGLVYVVTRDGVSNLWLQPVEGGAPRQLTEFKSEVIEGFDVSRAGDTVCSRGYVARDVVMVTDFR